MKQNTKKQYRMDPVLWYQRILMIFCSVIYICLCSALLSKALIYPPKKAIVTEIVSQDIIETSTLKQLCRTNMYIMFDDGTEQHIELARKDGLFDHGFFEENDIIILYGKDMNELFSIPWHIFGFIAVLLGVAFIEFSLTIKYWKVEIKDEQVAKEANNESTNL